MRSGARTQPHRDRRLTDLILICKRLRRFQDHRSPRATQMARSVISAMTTGKLSRLARYTRKKARSDLPLDWEMIAWSRMVFIAFQKNQSRHHSRHRLHPCRLARVSDASAGGLWSQLLMAVCGLLLCHKPGASWPRKLRRRRRYWATTRRSSGFDQDRNPKAPSRAPICTSDGNRRSSMPARRWLSSSRELRATRRNAGQCHQAGSRGADVRL